MNTGKLVREPLLHFLLIGLAFFALYGAVSPGGGNSKRVVVSQTRVDDMAHQYQALWGRPATPIELGGLIETYVHDEIIFREGQALGLERDDAVIKRRVIQKYDLMEEETGDRAAPTDVDLNGWLNAHPQMFSVPAVVSFDQVYFDQAAALPTTVAAAKAALLNGGSMAGLGQATLLPATVRAMPLDQVARDFGGDFAQQIAVLPIGGWRGPLVSALGEHLVRVNARVASRLPALDEVRAAVTREWENDRRERARDTSYNKLRGDYDVVIEARLPAESKPARDAKPRTEAKP